MTLILHCVLGHVIQILDTKETSVNRDNGKHLLSVTGRTASTPVWFSKKCIENNYEKNNTI